jgi:hypothetical protein
MRLNNLVCLKSMRFIGTVFICRAALSIACQARLPRRGERIVVSQDSLKTYLVSRSLENADFLELSTGFLEMSENKRRLR